MDRKPRVLFLCTHNAARSQMAEGIMRGLAKGEVDVFSAGTEPGGVH
jgi:protein-tyrosine-phosphatase